MSAPNSKSVYLNRIPGYAQAIQNARAGEFRQREDSWLGLTTRLAGMAVRVMTVRDYVALLRLQSPFVLRSEPTFEDLGTLLWVLSPEIDRWHNHAGWRKPGLVGCRWNLFSIEHWQVRLAAKRLRRRLKVRQLENAARAWNKANPGKVYDMPDDCPLALAFKAAFEYMDNIFLDRPAALAKEGTGSGLLYLTSWFDAIQSEYHKPDEDVWQMKLPVLFNRLKAIGNRLNPREPEFNARQDAIRRQLQQAISAGTPLESLKVEPRFTQN